MRVIAGEFRSRRLTTLPGLATRPTTDRLRETLFDVLGERVRGAVFLDAYAGTGSVGIEAVSRGAARAIFLEKRRAAVGVIEENLKALGIEARATVTLGDVAAKIGAEVADIVFLDPPYDAEREYRVLEKIRAPLVIVQHSKHFELAERYGALERSRVLKQGDNVLSFFTLA
jgi:16S rRNA (guanine966-N2)-methyltransferase